MVAAFPEGASASVFFVVPGAEAAFEHLHEFGDAKHLAAEPVEDGFSDFGLAFAAKGLDAPFGFLNVFGAEGAFHAGKDLILGELGAKAGGFFFVGDGEKEVVVVVEAGPGEQFQAAEGEEAMEEVGEVFLFTVSEEELAADDAVDDVHDAGG